MQAGLALSELARRGSSGSEGCQKGKEEKARRRHGSQRAGQIMRAREKANVLLLSGGPAPALHAAYV